MIDLTHMFLGLEAGSLDVLHRCLEDGWKMKISRAVILVSGEVDQLKSNGLITTSKKRGLIRVVKDESVRDSIIRFFEEGGIGM